MSKIKPEDINEEDILPDEGAPYGQAENPDSEKPKEDKEQPKDKAPESKVRDMLESNRASPKAFIENQADKHPESVKFDRVQVMVLNMGNADELAEYERVKTESLDPNLGLTLIFEDVQYNEKTDNWKVMLEINHYKFLPIV